MMLPMTVFMVRRSKLRKNVIMPSGNVIKEQKMLRNQVILGNMLKDLLERKKVRRVRNMHILRMIRIGVMMRKVIL